MFRPKQTKITNDYRITRDVLGTGISGNVVQCVHLTSGKVYALKPENLLFSSKGEDALLKLTDFGFAREVTAVNSLNTPCYTPYYAAKDLIQRLLLTEPAKRLSSKQVLEHPWVARHTTVPNTPLVTATYLSVSVRDHVNVAMAEELRGMRLDTENSPRLLPIDDSKNPLLKRRKKKSNKDGAVV